MGDANWPAFYFNQKVNEALLQGKQQYKKWVLI